MKHPQPEALKQAFLAEAEKLLAAGQNEHAAIMARKALDLAPENPHVARILAEALQRQDRHGDAYQVLAPFLERDPRDWETTRAVVRMLHEAGQRVSARLVLSRFTDIEPRHAEAKALLKQACNFYLDFFHGHESSGRDIHELAPRLAPGERPLFSVITPSFNQARFIEDTIRATMWQGLPSYEHIVIDGGSTDGTLETLRKYPHLQWVSEPDRGQTHALNKGFARARGEIIAWINSDDFHAPGAFAAVADWFARNPGERIVMGDCLWAFEQTGRDFLLVNREKGFEDIIRYWDDFFHPSQQALFFKRELLDEVGPLDESLNFAMDYDFFLRLTRIQPIRYMRALLGFYRFHGESKSGSGDDWSDFYPDQQRVYPRYKPHSRRLPQQTLLSAALPLPASKLGDARHLSALRQIIRHIGGDIMRDAEILVIGDAAESKKCLDVSDCPVPVRFLPCAGESPDEFVRVALANAAGYALHFPPLTRLHPLRWYTYPLDQLIDTPDATHVVDLRVHPGRHQHLPDTPLFGCHVLYRTKALRERDGSWSLEPPADAWATDAPQARLEPVPPGAKPDLSVIIPTHNRRAILLRCLDALARQTLPADRFEVIVCDDGSTDGTAEALRGLRTPFKLTCLRGEDCRGPAAARNRGILAAKSDLVMFLNDDAILDPGSLRIHWAAQRVPNRPPVSLVGRFVVPVHKPGSAWNHLLANSDLLFDYPRMGAGNIFGSEAYYTCNISTPKQALMAVGLFDEDFSGELWGAEDIEIGYRLQRLGVPVLYDACCSAVHEHELNVGAFCRMFRVRGGGAVRMFAKHPELSFHYSAISRKQVDLWRALPASVVRLVEMLKKLLGEFDRLELTPSPAQLFDANAAGAAELNWQYMGQWAMEPAQITALLAPLVEALAADLERFRKQGGSAHDAALRIYPAALFLRWHYDTLGIAANPRIENIIARSCN